eukprot:gene8285-biopygen22614
MARPGLVPTGASTGSSEVVQALQQSEAEFFFCLCVVVLYRHPVKVTVVSLHLTVCYGSLWLWQSLSAQNNHWRACTTPGRRRTGARRSCGGVPRRVRVRVEWNPPFCGARSGRRPQRAPPAAGAARSGRRPQRAPPMLRQFCWLFLFNLPIIIIWRAIEYLPGIVFPTPCGGSALAAAPPPVVADIGAHIALHVAVSAFVWQPGRDSCSIPAFASQPVTPYGPLFTQRGGPHVGKMQFLERSDCGLLVRKKTKQTIWGRDSIQRMLHTICVCVALCRAPMVADRHANPVHREPSALHRDRRQRARAGRGPIGCEEADANRTRAGRAQLRFIQGGTGRGGGEGWSGGTGKSAVEHAKEGDAQGRGQHGHALQWASEIVHPKCTKCEQLALELVKWTRQFQ